jgi:uncharacterized protein DUF4307
MLLGAVLGAVALAFLGWVVWAAWDAANPETRSDLLGFRVLDDHRVEVRFEVIASSGSPVTCSVQALDSAQTAVGVTDVTVPAGSSDRREGRAVVRTRDKAVSATVTGCRLDRDD